MTATTRPQRSINPDGGRGLRGGLCRHRDIVAFARRLALVSLIGCTPASLTLSGLTLSGLTLAGFTLAACASSDDNRPGDDATADVPGDGDPGDGGGEPCDGDDCPPLPLECDVAPGTCPALADFATFPPRPRTECHDPDATLPLSLTLGTGRDAFEAPAGLPRPLVETGPQGGFHTYAALRVEGSASAPHLERLFWLTACQRCGDGVVFDGTEACEPPTPGCRGDCTSACGDGVTQPELGEDCDTAGRSETCNANCTTSVCGDGIRNASAGESCDDGYLNGTPGFCNVDCTGLVPGVPPSPLPPPPCEPPCEPPAAPVCGNGVVECGESCDDGGPSATCRADCTPVTCVPQLIAQTLHEAPGPWVQTSPGVWDTWGELVIYSAIELEDAGCVRATLHLLATDADCNVYYDTLDVAPRLP